MTIIVSRPAKINGLLLIAPQRHSDNRGYFEETFNSRVLKQFGITCDFVQDNQSFSLNKNTVRGLHFQKPPFSQDKLVRCVSGAVYDVVVDLRAKSKTFGNWFGVELSQENGQQLFIPSGFAHGFCTLSENTILAYKCSSFYEKDAEVTLFWDDKDLSIDWRLSSSPTLSEKDLEGLSFHEVSQENIF